MREVPLFQFREPEGLGEFGQLHRKEAHGVDEAYLMVLETSQLQDFAPVPDLLEVAAEHVQLFDDGV